MKLAKRSLCLLLVLSVVFGMTGCKKSRFSLEDICEYAEDEDYEEFDDLEEFYPFVGARGFGDGNVYISVKGSEAEEVFNLLIYRFEPDHPDYDLTEATVLFASDDDGICMIIAATFKDTKDANEFLKKYPKSLDYDEEDKGNKNSCSYYIGNGKATGSRTMATGVYLSGNTVIWLKTLAEDCDAAEDFCKHFKLVSPLDT